MRADSSARGVRFAWRDAAPAVLVVLSFVSSGAWLIVTLPPVPMSKALNLVTVGVWLATIGFGLVAATRPDRRILLALGLVGASVAVSLIAGGSILTAVLYDIYADMPLVLWLAFPVMFLLAASVAADHGGIEWGLATIVVLGAVMSTTIAWQQFSTNGSGVFGSTAYSITALVPLIPLGVGLAASRRGWLRVALYACAAIVALGIGLGSAATMGTLAVAFAVLVSVAVHPVIRVSSVRLPRAVRIAALATAGLMISALLFVQVPALSGRWVNPDVFSGQKNVVSRVYLWQGAQRMMLTRPLAGFGPSGYRLAAAEYLDPGALRFGADQAGSIDPTAYSPQSPHSLLWEIGTRLGLLGLVAFAVLLVAWIAVLRDQMRDDAPFSDLRAALAGAVACALFTLLVNPAIFAIGLFVPVAAGLAVGGIRARPGDASTTTARRGSAAAVLAGLAVVLLASWLFAGEWRAYAARFEEPGAAIAGYEAALRITPGNPMTTRRLLENRLLVASDAQIGAAQSAVDSAPAVIRRFAPNLPSFAAYSLAQAQVTGRKDLSWEQSLLTRAAAQLPPIPSTVSEQLHLAVLSGDVAAIDRALPAAEQWGAPYPYNTQYVDAARQMKSAAP